MFKENHKNMNTELLKKYEAIKLEIRGLEAQLDAISPEVVAILEDAQQTVGVDQIETDKGKFYFTTRKSWKYTDAVKAKEEEVKELKKTEEETGVATCEESKSLTYRAK